MNRVVQSSIYLTVSKQKVIAGVLAALLALAAGVLVPKANIVPWNYMEAIIVLSVTLLSFAPLLRAWYTDSLDLFEPVYLVCFTTLVSFVVVPVWMLLRGLVSSGGVDYRPELAGTIALSGLGLLSFYFGYYPSLHHWRHSLPGRLSKWLGRSLDRRSACKWSSLGLIAAILSFLAWLRIGHVPLSALSVFAPGSTYGGARLVAQNSVMYLFMTRMSWLTLVLMAYAYRRPGKGTLIISLAWLLILIFEIAYGDRSEIFRSVITVIVYLYLVKARRPSLQIVLVIVVGFALLAGIIVTLRSRMYDVSISQLELATALTALERDLTEAGAATGVMVMLRVFPHQAEFMGWGAFSELAYAATPRILWPDKPVRWGALTVADQFVPAAHAPSFIGTWYAIFGVLGVIVAMIVLGAVSARIYVLCQRYPESEIAKSLLTLWIGFFWMIYHRGDITWSVVNIGYIFGPVFLIAALARSRTSPRQGYPRQLGSLLSNR